MERPADIPLTHALPDAGANVVPPWMRGIDITCCLLALPALILSTIVMTAVIRLVSPGPLFYRQERVGFRGRRFKIVKFRTMKVAADPTVHEKHFTQLMDSNTPMVKLDAQRDARLIPGAWMLRASGMDELPQIINVLRGEMSLVGPRPCVPGEFEKYLPSHRERVNAVPGLTGLWQVSGKNRTTFEEMMRLDIHYVRNISPQLYFKIILLTPWALAVQVCDTRRIRKSSAQGAPTGPSIPATNRVPLAAPWRPNFAGAIAPTFGDRLFFRPKRKTGRV